MVEAFDNLDDMLEAMKENMDQADKRIQPWQPLIRPGEYFMRQGPPGITIYGEMLKDPKELKRDEYTENYRFCRAYSVACSEGELGDVHVSTIERIISPEEFQTAKRRGWR